MSWMAMLTGCIGSSITSGAPLLMEALTARLEGICAATGCLSVFSTSSTASPTLESERLSTTSQDERG